MAVKKIGYGGLAPLALNTISLSNSTAVAVNSTCQASADVLHISVETNAVRYRADGTDPALTTGVVLQKDNDYWWYHYNRTSVLKFQRTTGTATVYIQPYQWAADN